MDGWMDGWIDGSTSAIGSEEKEQQKEAAKEKQKWCDHRTVFGRKEDEDDQTLRGEGGGEEEEEGEALSSFCVSLKENCSKSSMVSSLSRPSSRADGNGGRGIVRDTRLSAGMNWFS